METEGAGATHGQRPSSCFQWEGAGEASSLGLDDFSGLQGVSTLPNCPIPGPRELGQVASGLSVRAR